VRQRCQCTHECISLYTAICCLPCILQPAASACCHTTPAAAAATVTALVPAASAARVCMHGLPLQIYFTGLMHRQQHQHTAASNPQLLLPHGWRVIVLPSSSSHELQTTREQTQPICSDKHVIQLPHLTSSCFCALLPKPGSCCSSCPSSRLPQETDTKHVQSW
jgi:hypothetical protein